MAGSAQNRSACRGRRQRSVRAACSAAFVIAAAATAMLYAAVPLPKGPGVDLVYARCQVCHDLQFVTDAKGLLPNQWRAVVASMKDYGLKIDDAEQRELVTYLSTYLGPGAPPASAVAASATPATAVDGRALFMRNCAACHGADGRGQRGTFPPLAGNADVRQDRLLATLVVLHGMSGRIQVDGTTYEGSMPSFGHLSNGEVAAVVNYVRNGLIPSSGDDSQAVTPALVAAQREHGMSPAEVHAFRAAVN